MASYLLEIQNRPDSLEVPLPPLTAIVKTHLVQIAEEKLKSHPLRDYGFSDDLPQGKLEYKFPIIFLKRKFSVIYSSVQAS